MILKALKRLIILGAIIKFTNCKSDSKGESDATSRIRFVQYQPAKLESEQQNADNAASLEQEAKSSKIFADVSGAFNRREDQLSHNDDEESSSVPKNYAFAYAIRDRNSGDDFSHTQAHNGQATKGQYRVKLPDGRVQIVTYMADNGGYRADIHYDKGSTIYEGQPDNSGAYPQSRSTEKPFTGNLMSASKQLNEKTDSPLLYLNEMMSFGVTTTGRTPASYETVETVDEGQLPYDKKLVDDVNYLLKYVAPTIESRTENVFDITPDHVPKQQQSKSDNNEERQGRFNFELPPDFPFQGPADDTKKYLPSGNAEPANVSRPKIDFPQFVTPRPPIFRTSESPQMKQEGLPQYTPKYQIHGRPHLFVPLRVQPQFVTAKYESQEQPRFSSPKYNSREQPRLTSPKYDQRGPPQFSTPKYNSQESPFLNIETETRPHTPKYGSQEQSRFRDSSQFGSSSKESPLSNIRTDSRPLPVKYDSQEQPKFNNIVSTSPKYESGESPLLNIRTETRPFSPPSNQLRYTPKVELRDQIQPPKYDPRGGLRVTTPRYQSGEEFIATTPRYQSGERGPFVTSPRYQSGERGPLVTSPRYQSGERGPSITSTQYQSGEESPQLSTAKYESPQGLPELVLRFENQSPFDPPKLDAQKFRPSQPFVPRTESSEKPLFASQSPDLALTYRPQFDTSRFTSSPTTTSKYQQLEGIGDNSAYNNPADISSLESPGQRFKEPLQNEKYNSQEYSPHSFKDVLQNQKFNSQEYPPVSPGPNFNSQEHPQVAPVPSYPNSKETPPVSSVGPQLNNVNYQSTTPTIPLFRPINHDRRPNAQFGKIEIPQYLHIHRYESGEDAKPKELIYYTPLQIPIANSVAYMERGNLSDIKNPQVATYTPAFVTMTEHPRLPGAQNAQYPEGLDLYDQARFEIPANLTNINLSLNPEAPNQPETESPDFKHQFNDLKFANHPIYKDINFDARPLNPPAVQKPQRPHVTTSGFGEEQHHSYENMEDMPFFDPRTYSGYFDFLPSGEMQEEKPVSEDDREIEPNQQISPPRQQYLYDYATATPTHRYMSSEFSSHEKNNVIPKDDPLRNTSFRASAYLRPLHKERVYIHHNSQPTTPSDDHYSGIASTTRMQKKTADISIVKSISSTIPPELLKDFDYQLSASILRDTLHDGSEQKAKSTSASQASPATAPVNSKLNKNIVKKLQTALSTNGKVYLKTPTQQGKTVS